MLEGMRSRSLGLVAVLGLLWSCAASKPAPKPVDPLQGLENCPEQHEVALRDGDAAHMNDLLAGAKEQARADRGRCALAERECVSACAAYTARCPKPYAGMNGRIPDEQAAPSDFCDDACDGTDPYLTLARYFSGTACSLSASTRPPEPIAE